MHDGLAVIQFSSRSGGPFCHYLRPFRPSKTLLGPSTGLLWGFQGEVGISRGPGLVQVAVAF